jgi:protocatechuate 3,4-dioxygenase beta subunit
MARPLIVLLFFLIGRRRFVLGPYHRANAPLRAKVTPPLVPGTVLVISGRVWRFDMRRPIDNVVIDIWQANAEGRYDNDDPRPCRERRRRNIKTLTSRPRSMVRSSRRQVGACAG